MGANCFPNHGTKHGWVLALHPTLPTFLWCLVFSIIILKGRIFSARLYRFFTNTRFLLPNFQRIFILLCFFCWTTVMSLRVNERNRERICKGENSSPQSTSTFISRGSLYTRVYTKQTERKWSWFLQQLSSASQRFMW